MAKCQCTLALRSVVRPNWVNGCPCPLSHHKRRERGARLAADAHSQVRTTTQPSHRQSPLRSSHDCVVSCSTISIHDFDPRRPISISNPISSILGSKARYAISALQLFKNRKNIILAIKKNQENYQEFGLTILFSEVSSVDQFLFYCDCFTSSFADLFGLLVLQHLHSISLNPKDTLMCFLRFIVSGKSEKGKREIISVTEYENE
ncbi:hypothetical protein RND71_003456 [Anisodus tanguticus]|uniref:Uncharacterized protein n=1 Tax=Anisodus tanguticus TaxID=243964 RepID=A0AAE1SVW9_9SOLA|nr:hypothetical protein RND71_003456 [Anisodus tanguticus]